MIVRLLLLSSALSFAPLAQACETPRVAALSTEAALESAGEELRAVVVQRLDGSSLTLGELLPGLARGELVVLSASEVGCPIAGKLAPRLARLAHEFEARGVRFLAFDASLQDSLTGIEHESAELARDFPIVKDPRQELARRLDVRTTTEVFVFDGRGGLVYRGAVDDQYTLGAARPAPLHAYLAQALQAALAGNAPELARTEAPGCVLTLLAASEPAPVTYSRDIAPILRKRCETCHRPGQVGPFALQSFEDAKGHAKMIASVLEDSRMPPWNADARFDGMFSNQRKLPEAEKQALLHWVADGMSRGNPSEDPAPKKWPEGWSIGTPDVVIAMQKDEQTGANLPAQGYAVPREGVVDYQYFSAKTDYPEDRWIQALEVKAGAKDVVHHVLVAAVENPKAKLNERGYLAVYVPGDTPSVFPEGYAKRLSKGATLIFQLHYTPNGKERFDRSSIAIIFAKEPPAFEVKTDAVVNDEFEIPAGAPNHEVRGSRTFSEDTGVVALFPHMHKRGKDFRFVAHLPDGSDQELLFAHYDFNWQESYLLPDPLLLPMGTKLECIGHYDNSAANPNNPDATKKVEWGDQTFEEMFIGYFDTVVPLE